MAKRNGLRCIYMHSTESYNYLGPIDPHYAIKRLIKIKLYLKLYLSFRTGTVCNHQVAIGIYAVIERAFSAQSNEFSFQSGQHVFNSCSAAIWQSFSFTVVNISTNLRHSIFLSIVRFKRLATISCYNLTANVGNDQTVTVNEICSGVLLEFFQRFENQTVINTGYKCG